MKSVGQNRFELPSRAAVMVLPHALLLPNALLPLFIFEPQYRLMLDWCLHHDRMFSVALMHPGIKEARSRDDFFQTAGLGVIRACVKNPDGTSHLILQGVHRVRFKKFLQESPFRVAEIEALETRVENSAEATQLGGELIQLCRKLQTKGVDLPAVIHHQLNAHPNPEVLSDLLTGALVQDPFLRQQLLERTALSERLRMLITYLGQQFK